MLNINKIIFVGETQFGTVFVKVRPHLKDPTKLALKANMPEVSAVLCKSMGVEPGNEWRGSNHFITEVDKAAFVTGLGHVADALKTLEAAPQPKALSAGPCMECGCDDGTHWGFCSQHHENKAKVLN